MRPGSGGRPRGLRGTGLHSECQCQHTREGCEVGQGVGDTLTRVERARPALCRRVAFHSRAASEPQDRHRPRAEAAPVAPASEDTSAKASFQMRLKFKRCLALTVGRVSLWGSWAGGR